MTITRLLLTSSSALVLSLSAALADDNFVLLEQEGESNSALIDQTGADNSSVGHVKPTPSGPGGIVDGIAKQVGDDNVMNITQIGSANRVAPGPFNDGRADQLGDGNTLSIVQARDPAATGSSGNRVGTTIQVGDNHEANITQTTSDRPNNANLRQSNGGSGEDGNTASIVQNNTGSGQNNILTSTTDGGVAQNGQRNIASVEQDGTRLRLRRLRQIGDDNSANVLMTGESNGVAPYELTDGFSGASNASASEVNQTGDLNVTALSIGGTGNSYGVEQAGNENLALGIVVTGNDNSVGVGQF